MFQDTATTEIYTLSLHDALPICQLQIAERPHAAVRVGRFRAIQEVRAGENRAERVADAAFEAAARRTSRSEAHTSELQSRRDLVCRLLLEEKKQTITS